MPGRVKKQDMMRYNGGRNENLVITEYKINEAKHWMEERKNVDEISLINYPV